MELKQQPLKQTLNEEQSFELLDNGVPIEAASAVFMKHGKFGPVELPLFTAADLLNIMPERIEYHDKDVKESDENGRLHIHNTSFGWVVEYCYVSKKTMQLRPIITFTSATLVVALFQAVRMMLDHGYMPDYKCCAHA